MNRYQWTGAIIVNTIMGGITFLIPAFVFKKPSIVLLGLLFGAVVAVMHNHE